MNRHTLLISVVDTQNPHIDITQLQILCKQQDKMAISLVTVSTAPNSEHNIHIPLHSTTGFSFKLSIEYALKVGFDWILPIQCQDLPTLIQNFGACLQCLPTLDEAEKILIGYRTKHQTSVLFQKRFWKKSIDDFYSPIKIFRTNWFKNIPFQYNEEKDFRDELTIQILLSKVLFATLPIESDISVVHTVSGRVRKLFWEAQYHVWGVFYKNKFDCVIDNQQYSLKLGYASSHTYVIDAVKDGSKVVDIGAGPYGISPYLLDKSCDVTTIDMFDIPEQFKKVKHIIANLNETFDIPLEEYDYILFLDIIEHLLNPETFLAKVSEQFGHKKQKLILTTGNIAFFPLRLMLGMGYFNYGKSGILDKTHTRLFTFKTFKKLLQDSNLKITKIRGIPAPFPKALGNNFISKFLLWVNLSLIQISKGGFSYQIYVEAETTTTTSYLINEHEYQK